MTQSVGNIDTLFLFIYLFIYLFIPRTAEKEGFIAQD